MPDKVSLREKPKAAPSGVAALASSLVAGDGTSGVTVGRPDALSSVSGDREQRVPPPAPDSLASLTARLGAKTWSFDRQFEWARAANRHHFTFTRFYKAQNVIVDVWPAPSSSVRIESFKRQQCIESENVRRTERGEAPYGYLSIVRGAIVSDEAFDRVLRGEVLPLLERSTTGVLA